MHLHLNPLIYTFTFTPSILLAVLFNLLITPTISNEL